MESLNKVFCIIVLGFLVSGTKCIKNVGVDETIYNLSVCENLPKIPKFKDNDDWFLSRDDKPQVECDGFSAYYLQSLNRRISDGFLISLNSEKCQMVIRRRAYCEVGRTDEECAQVFDDNYNRWEDEIIAELIFGYPRKIRLIDEVRTRKTLKSFEESCRWVKH